MKNNFFLPVMYLMIFYISGNLISQPYRGAEYRTIEAFTYGRFETSYKPPRADGMVASFFTYHEITDTTAWNEIDFEILGRYDDIVQVTSIGPGQAIRNSHQLVNFNPHDDFHTYAFEWTPNYIAWLIDDIEVYRQTGTFISDFQHPQKLMMNIWPPVYTAWTGTLDPTTLPLFALYEYASYASYTPGTGNVGTNNDFTFQWMDEFDSWNQSRWEKATHTFPGNNCTFVVDNAVFQNGKLILCLTEPSSLGYIDNIAPSGLWARGHDNNTITVRFSEKVDSISGQLTSNYLLTGVTVNNVELQSDKQTAVLDVTGFDTTMTYNFVLRNIQDLFGNTMSIQVMPLHIAKPLAFPVNINVGGDASLGFREDKEWSHTEEYGHESGYIEAWPDTIDIGNTNNDAIYRNGLHDVVNYKVRVPTGQYRLTLMFCENDHFVLTSPRMMSIFVEGINIADSLNLQQTYGFHYAHNLITNILDITDGIIDIHFTNLSNYSLLNGIMVEQISTEIDKYKTFIPADFNLGQNYPNPFNPVTKISYKLPVSSKIIIEVFDSNGRVVNELIRMKHPAGEYEVEFDGAEFASGVYFYRLQINSELVNKVITKKMILIK